MMAMVSQILNKTYTLVFVLLLLGINANHHEEQIPLQCTTNGQGEQVFRIMQFTDAHFGETEEKDINSTIEFTNLLNYEKPNLVVLSGDMVSGYAWNGSVTPWFPKQFDKVVSPIINSSTYWAYTLGNHDAQADYNRTQIMEYAMNKSFSLSQLGPKNIGGASNYVLTVKSQNNTPIVNIWFMDSLEQNCYGVEGWNCVEFTTIEWYDQTSQALEEKYGRKIPGIVYIHIPIPELLNLFNNFNTIGECLDGGIACWSLNTGLFSQFKLRNDIISIWHGHDHDNDFYGNYHNITIGYGRKTGFGSYGPPKNMSRGARVIEFKCENNNLNINNFTWETWIRQDDGTTITNPIHHSPAQWKEESRTICHGSVGIEKYGPQHEWFLLQRQKVSNMKNHQL